MRIQERKLEDECNFSASRSSGPGGQNVNKVNSQIELRFPVNQSEKLNTSEKSRIKQKLGNRINQQGELLVVANQERSQHKNKQLAIERFYTLLQGALKVVPRRKKTKPSKAYHLKRLEQKRKHSQKKALRSKNF